MRNVGRAWEGVACNLARLCPGWAELQLDGGFTVTEQGSEWVYF